MANDLVEFAKASLAEKLGPVSVPAGSGRHNEVEAEVDGPLLNVSLKTTAYAALGRFEQMKRDEVDPPGDGTVLVVADRINAPAREAIQGNGWAISQEEAKVRTEHPGSMARQRAAARRH